MNLNCDAASALLMGENVKWYKVEMVAPAINRPPPHYGRRHLVKLVGFVKSWTAKATGTEGSPRKCRTQNVWPQAADKMWQNEEINGLRLHGTHTQTISWANCWQTVKIFSRNSRIQCSFYRNRESIVN